MARKGGAWSAGRCDQWELRNDVARFFGRYEHSLDLKGRVILPAKFRAHFEHGGYLTKFREGCLALWTPDEFERQMVAMQEKAETGGQADRNLARLWSSGTADVEVDRQGRLAIPQYLRDYAQLAGDVLVHGAIDRVELWSPAVWQEKVEPDERRLTGDES